MSGVYDNWERLVAAVLRKEQLWQLFHQDSRSPSTCSEASDFSSSFDFRASGELLGKGTFGSSYTSALDDGITIVVKRLKLVSISEQNFKRHVEIVGNIVHENVVPLRAYYSNKDEKLMLYDYYSIGSVSSLLHGKTVEIQDHVDWETRIRIAIGAARGISQIHMQNGGKFVHGNIKSSNIFLTPQQYGCVSDLGLVNMVTTTFMRTARCYAPEVKNTQNVSQASDVYSFGILLFELLTRKSPVQVHGGPEAVDLAKLVNSVKSKDWIAKVFDTDLLNNPSINKQMVKMLQIGISCVAKSPKKRPKMSEVVTMIEDMRLMNTENHVPVPTDRKLVFFENGVPPFDLEDMLKASAEVLGEGTFGNSYMASLKTGDTIMVKRLRNVNVTKKEFHQDMEVIGRIRHENVAKLRTYSYSKDYKLLVYDYYYQDSLSILLHGRSGGAGRISLDWESRLKIAIGVARGIAHIHTLDGSKFVHGNIKASNIFLNRQQYGCVTDVALAKLVRPINLSALPTPGYCAPEFRDTSRVSQASDVYSFGVVLLQLLTGKPSQLTADDGELISLVRWIQAVIQAERTVEVLFDEELWRYGIQEGAVLLFRIALSCVAKDSKLRPRMAEVVKTFHNIIGIDIAYGIQPSRMEGRLLIRSKSF